MEKVWEIPAFQLNLFQAISSFVFNIFLAYEILPDVQAESAAGCPVPDCRGNGKTDVPCGFARMNGGYCFINLFLFFEINS
ncbi:Uncharacterised protein [Neisseria gonorrhoeae]|uniref:Uncharacterized protein n=1 Tax=Neisseria gonorrhoeae TaxID=485 RepID=A0A378VUJ6_NEIGO|nr:Uncharacterised protein [Neisseria gonorrhoeae]